MRTRVSGARAGYARVAAALAAVVAAGCVDGAPGAKSHSVSIQGFQYQPAALTVAVGDTVVWINGDVVPHTATAADRAWDSGSIAGKASGRVVMEKAGTHRYVCAFHPNMKAEVVAR
ncbi:MAG TPA: cupredoxin family copper-binding protein [Longimicrobium sp.]|nr:cupredoxin family copper-binding protein [Longimicrobium sp.]